MTPQYLASVHVTASETNLWDASPIAIYRSKSKICLQKCPDCAHFLDTDFVRFPIVCFLWKLQSSLGDLHAK